MKTAKQLVKDSKHFCVQPDTLLMHQRLCCIADSEIVSEIQDGESIH